MADDHVMSMADNLPNLETIVEELADEYPLDQVLVVPETVEKINGVYNFALVLNFPDGVPVMPYSDNRLTVDIGGKKAIAQLKPVSRDPDYWVVQDAGFVQFASVFEGEVKLYQHRLETLLNEVTISAEQIQSLSQGEDGETDLFQFIAISAFDERTEDALAIVDEVVGDGSYKSEKVSPEIQLTVSVNSPHHIEISGINSQGRFKHVNTLTVDGENYPVEIKTCLLEESLDGGLGQMIHTSDFMAEHTDAENMDFDEEIREIDLDKLLHGKSPWPDDPITW